MIGYLKGTVILVSDNREILVEAGNSGVGYRILMASTDTAELAVGQTVEFHIYTQVREDAIELYGFKTRDERTLFTRLVTVSGVGAKMALAILGTLSGACRASVQRSPVVSCSNSSPISKPPVLQTWIRPPWRFPGRVWTRVMPTPARRL